MKGEGMTGYAEFGFILDEFEGLNVVTKPMFGARGVYVDGKIVFILRDRPTSPADNGVWLATTPEHHESLRAEFPNMRSLEMFGPGPTGWQNLPLDSDDFEEAVLKACRFVRAGDQRIGKIPKKSLRRKPQKKSEKSLLRKRKSPLKVETKKNNKKTPKSARKSSAGTTSRRPRKG